MHTSDHTICIFSVLLIFFFSVGALIISHSVTSSTKINNEEIPYVKDLNLKVELVASGLHHPTSMIFLGHDDLLVLEKNKGTVQRITNGKISEQPLLDVNVASQNERGMLGIAADRSSDGRTFVYIYFTQSLNEDGEDVQNGTIPLGNRLYKYELVGKKLVNPEVLFSLPGSKHSAHNGGKLLIGPDHNLYLTIGDGDSCVDRSKKVNGKYVCSDSNLEFILNSKSSNIVNGAAPAGRGGIIRMTQSGDPVNGGIIGKADPLNMYYAYGIRNSFGIDFDPVNGNLWDTENGPGFGDEINMVIPGFNSGWLKIQGFWPVFTYNPVPLERGYFNHTTINIMNELVNFDGNGKYVDPKLAWNITVGPTALKFFNSTQFGPQYENDLFVSDINKGRIFHFDLNKNRTELILRADLADKVANSTREFRDSVFAGGFGGITDIQVGPDGYLYVLSYPNGKIYRILPIDLKLK
jgi:aldose sugar dehydrogenase